MYTVFFAFPVRLYLQAKLPSSVKTAIPGNIGALSRTSAAMKIQHELYERFHNDYRVSNDSQYR